MEKQLDEGRGDVGLVYHIRLPKYAKILGSIVFRHVRLFMPWWVFFFAQTYCFTLVR